MRDCKARRASSIALKDPPELHLLTPDVATLFFHMDFVQPDGRRWPDCSRRCSLSWFDRRVSGRSLPGS
ncbi:hypothetical protein [Croceibacterium mercuriale]|uniref:hypothetical protein n=1 Tax=Croceibacterium mercuriale TaxID=1572751 RepID=UPI00126A55E2|nr:hypothetical protein [Croceibacterium mercuriale]